MTRTIAVLIIAGFGPVSESLAARINRPGGNATGFGSDVTEPANMRTPLESVE